jgi:hypothetical protein|tara:strand:- start:1273 stop:1677 length:405 start_codon:yes stop_codon:yes gene_type:complete
MEPTDGMNVDKLVSVFIKIRDAREEAKREWEEIDSEFVTKLDLINQELLSICKNTGADSIKTKDGTAIRTIKSKYWTNDWERFYDWMFEHNVPEVLERRIHQTNIKQFLAENPDMLPPGLNVDNAYHITVRRSK